MRRLRVLSVYRLQTLPLKARIAGSASGRLNIHSTYQRFVREQVPHLGSRYARRRYTAAHVADTNKRVATTAGIVAMHHDRQRFVGTSPSGLHH